MIMFECKKCKSLVPAEKDAKTATCKICGKPQRITAEVIENVLPANRIDSNPQWKHYLELLYKAKNYRDIDILTETADELDRLWFFEGSREMAKLCRERNAEEQAKRAKELERQKINEQRSQKGQRQHRIKMAILNACVVALLIAITLIPGRLLKEPILADQYNNAIALMEKGNYPFAIKEFTELRGYKDSDTFILECKYLQAQKYMDEGKFRLAWQHFSAIAEYKDAAVLAEEAKAKLPNP